MPRTPTAYHPHGVSRESSHLAYEKERGTSTARGYDRQWAKAARLYRAEHPLCEYCEMLHDRVTAAALVDHLYPHRGDRVIFWLSTLWVSCCDNCHSEWKQLLEQQGIAALDTLARRLGRPTLAEAMRGARG